MAVFISYSFEDKPEFDNIADALEQKGIEYWKPLSLKAGSLLSEQLRQSIVEADLCVFVATRHSVASSWCGAELGAFWGAGKPVLIYVAEASLPEAELPKQFQGHFLERRIARVVEAVQAELLKMQKPEQRADQAPVVGSMTREELKLLLTDIVNRSQDAAFVETTLTRVALLFGGATGHEASLDQPELRELLTGLIGIRGTVVLEGGKRTHDWNGTLFFSTDTGNWSGIALRYEHHSDPRAPISYYKDCIVWRVAAGQRVEAVALLATLTDHETRGIVGTSGPLLMVGRGTFGTVVPDQ